MIDNELDEEEVVAESVSNAPEPENQNSGSLQDTNRINTYF